MTEEEASRALEADWQSDSAGEGFVDTGSLRVLIHARPQRTARRLESGGGGGAAARALRSSGTLLASWASASACAPPRL